MIIREIYEFELEAIKHGEAIEKGDSKSANKAYKKIHNNYLSLKSSNRFELIALLDNQSHFVRIWAARYSLEIEPKKSIFTLEQLGKLQDTSVSFDARMTLMEWKEGNLKF
jgi:hypothetical protein